ncbi:MAG: phosphate ABC transporter permease subunit PstC [Bdellovibrionales bacterium]|nr:phosphate ABC transporter permease subunit PstC [Bdellovibrionales bacterium]
MSTASPITSPSPSRRPSTRPINPGDRLFRRVLMGLSGVVVAVLALIAIYLAKLSWPAIHEFGLGFFWTTDWDPVKEHFGAGAFIFGTLVSSFFALALAVPLSIAVGLFLTELAPPRAAAVVGFMVEMLAAIPSVVYGLWGIFFLAPLLRLYVQPFLGRHFGWLFLFQGPPYGIGMLAAGLILAIMVTPTITAICREVFRAVPNTQREAALGLGATKWEMIRLAVVKSSWSGVFGAGILGLGRALGETMAVTMLIGNRNEISTSLFSPGQTMASVIANEYAEAGSNIHVAALAYVGLALFVVSFAVNHLARRIVKRLEMGGTR